MRIQKLILKDIAKEEILLELYGSEKNIKKHKMSTRSLFGRMKNASFIGKGRDGVWFKEGGCLSLDTFQNSFSTGKWNKYTTIDKVYLALEIQGHFKISLMHAFLVNKKVHVDVLSTEEVKSDSKKECIFDFGKLKDNGIFYAEIQSLEDKGILFSGYYGTTEFIPTQNVKLAVDICTFKREKYVERNMKILKRDILENPESPCYNKIWIHISDNACSLEGIVDSERNITVDKNANLGGVGGFTRGIIETKKRQQEEQFTHILIMDDDATISSAAVEINYILLSCLKEKYLGYTIGGKLMVLDTPFMQYEVGAQWNAGDIKALKNCWDMRQFENVIDSESEDEIVEYQGWWYCCIPLKEISDDNLPLPIFIHRDDVEYGLRTGKERFIYMNQICIWHEAFAGKMPGVLDYYDIRNHCIVNAIQCPEYSRKEFKRFLAKWVWRNVAKYRYKYVDYNIKAVEDFCKGIDWLLQTDGEALHKELLAMNYSAKPVEEFIGMYGFTEEDAKRKEKKYYNPFFIIRWFHKLTANGYFFSPKSEKIVVTAPYGSVHRLYRRVRTIVVDSFGKGVYLERDLNKFWECKHKLDKVMKLIDDKYDYAAAEYHERYKELVSCEFWKKYLDI